MFAPYLVLVAWIDRIFGKFRGAGGDDAKPRGDGLWYVLSRIGTLKLLAIVFWAGLPEIFGLVTLSDMGWFDIAPSVFKHMMGVPNDL